MEKSGEKIFSSLLKIKKRKRRDKNGNIGDDCGTEKEI